MSDKYDDEAAKLLPCDCNNRDGREGHFSSCGGYWRDEVGARLRADGAEIERLRTLDKTMAKAHNSNLVEMANMREEIGQLKVQLAGLHGAIMNLPLVVEFVDTDSTVGQAYRLGHRDARHASAELCAAAHGVNNE